MGVIYDSDSARPLLLEDNHLSIFAVIGFLRLFLNLNVVTQEQVYMKRLAH